MEKNRRRDFIKKGAGAFAGGVAGASLLASCKEESPASLEGFNINKNQKFKWRAVTTWPPNFPVVGESIVSMADDLRVMSGGRLDIKVYGAGELVPALECFDAVTQGAVHMGHGASYNWTGKLPAAPFFTSIPFGMNAQQLNAWLRYGGGQELWEELYEPFDLLPFACGNTGVQMGGWFNKEINTTDDLQGLKMRMPGLGGHVITKAGGSAQNMPGGEIYTNLERGVIDATEWIGPYHDYLMGFHKVAKFYYYPGWHEPGSNLELIVKKEAFFELPADIQEMIRTVSFKYNQTMISEFEAKNNKYLGKILEESDTQLKMFPEEVLATLKVYADEVVDELIADNPFGQKVYANFSEFKRNIVNWGKLSERAIMPYL
ncbi:TRAP transporter substrate-binding protein [Flammeovirgaceae bacterium SG7u.111]|nr:TRAP transporter substrate-binding protein [Flammeovirgaceae bacterium SG7u.132]WPO35827.1 TRAP transporter substrate-binding protein [Flammeovirgaceae bacterium SG7u.111]